MSPFSPPHAKTNYLSLSSWIWRKTGIRFLVDNLLSYVQNLVCFTWQALLCCGVASTSFFPQHCPTSEFQMALKNLFWKHQAQSQPGNLCVLCRTFDLSCDVQEMELMSVTQMEKLHLYKPNNQNRFERRWGLSSSPLINKDLDLSRNRNGYGN